jgi:GST-like protein
MQANISSPYTLYGAKGSGSAAVEAALIIAGVEYRLVEAASWKPGRGLDALRAINPLAQIPTLLLPDAGVLTESAAILIYLDTQFPGSGLLPADVLRKAQAVRGLVFIAANCYAAIGVIDYPERWCSDPDEPLRERIISGSTRRLYEYWDTFADAFPAAPWLSGEFLGALDLLAATVSKWSGSRQHLAQSRPDFSALLEKIESDPRVAPVFLKHWPKQ